MTLNENKNRYKSLEILVRTKQTNKAMRHRIPSYISSSFLPVFLPSSDLLNTNKISSL